MPHIDEEVDMGEDDEEDDDGTKVDIEHNKRKWGRRVSRTIVNVCRTGVHSYFRG